MPILWRPLAYYRELLARDIAWRSALVPVVLWMLLTVLTSTVQALRNNAVAASALQSIGGPEVPAGLSVLVSVLASLLGIAVAFWLPTITILVIAVVRGAEGRRVLECSAVACWSQIPWGIASLIWVAALLELEPLDVSGVGVSEFATAMQAYQENMRRTPTMLTFNLMGSFAGLWLIGLLCGALRAVARLSVGGAWTVGFLAGGFFVVLPWAVQRFSLF
ncbi:MAG: hypothetical protein OXH04_01145 [Acidobacteria bacterium]|nr:hypothetical protein [Acidobacteriota bacterium]